MADRDTYKTKLCVYYQRSRCFFNSCKFAHGSAELRRPLIGDRGSVELEERIHRNRSPDRRHGKAIQTSHGDSSPEKSDRNVRKRTRWDVRGDQTKDKAKMKIDDQLREAYAEISRLEDDKQRLQMYLEDKDKEADSLTSELHELEMQLSEEKEKGKRFIEAHNRHLRLQDELKRSEAQLQKLAENLDLDVGEGSEDDALSDDEDQLNSSSRRLRSRVEVRDTSPPVQRQR